MRGFRDRIARLDAAVMRHLGDGVCQYLSRTGQVLADDVPVIVELCPAQSSATANSSPARLVPSSGLSSRCASRRSVTSRPAGWKTSAARTRIDALMQNATFNAISVSRKLKRSARLLASVVSGATRVCTSDECR